VGSPTSSRRPLFYFSMRASARRSPLSVEPLNPDRVPLIQVLAPIEVEPHPFTIRRAVLERVLDKTPLALSFSALPAYTVLFFVYVFLSSRVYV